MNKIVTSADANRSFSKVLRDVQQGASVVVTSHGRAVAKIVAVDEDDPRKDAAWKKHLEALRRRPAKRIAIGRWSRDELYDALTAQGIFSRRYFHPLLARLPMYRDLPGADPANLPIATRAAEQILCLPIYPDLSPGDQDRVIDIVRGKFG